MILPISSNLIYRNGFNFTRGKIIRRRNKKRENRLIGVKNKRDKFRYFPILQTLFN